jgi:hypothetical protein
MYQLNTIQRRIKLSILAVVLIFLMTVSVFGSSMVLFDQKVRADTIPQSMIENPRPIQHDGDALWLTLLLGVGCIGFPLGFYVLRTLHDIGEFHRTDLG